MDAASPEARLVVQAARKGGDGVLLGTSSVVVIAATTDWDFPAVQRAVQDVLAPGLTASALGVRWHDVKEPGGHSELDGLLPLQIARRGKLIFVSNDAAALSAILQAKSLAPVRPVSYTARFNHTRQLQEF